MMAMLLPPLLPLASFQMLANIIPYFVPEATTIGALVGFTWDVYQKGLIPKLFSMAASRDEFQTKVGELLRGAFQKYTPSPESPAAGYVYGSSMYKAYTWLTSFYSKSPELMAKEFRDKTFEERNRAINRIYDQMLEKTGGISSGEWVVIEPSDLADL